MVTVLDRTTKTRPKPWTLADLARLFGPMPPERIQHDPLPDLAKARDALAVHDRKGKLLTGGKVLPGFKVRVEKIFSALDEL